jgi:lipoic acid synthetase
VPKGKTEELEDDEPQRVAEAARRLGLKHVVITSVTRDDLPDGGAEHFRRTVEAVRQATGASIEVLVPDFIGKPGALEQLLESRPEVFNHNTETVPRLYRQVRGRKSVYEWTLTLLADTKKIMPGTKTKSGLMLGLGETREELLQVFADLLSHGVDFLTLGQYLQPTIDMSIQMNLMSLAMLPGAWVFSKLHQDRLFGQAIMLVRWLKPRKRDTWASGVQST